METKSRGENPGVPAAAIFFLILWMVFFYRVFGGFFLTGGDLVNHYIPNRHFFKTWILKGVFPLWNPHTFSGRPLIADVQLGMFYPPNWFSLFLPLPAFFTLSAAFHLWFGSLGSYLLAGRFLRRQLPRYFFSLVFSFSAFFTARLYSGIVVFIYTASFIPWILLAAEVWREKRTPGKAILLGALLALQLLSGSPQLAFYTWIALVALFIIQAVLSREWKSLWKGYAGAACLMVALSAVQFLPTKEFIDRSYSRAGGAKWQYITDGSLEPSCLLTQAFPNFYCPPWRDEIYWAGMLGYWEYCGYMGVAPLVLFILFFLTKPRDHIRGDSPKRRFFLLSLAFLGLGVLLSFGKYSPVFRLFYMLVPGFRSFRVPARMILYCILAAGFLSSMAFERILDLSTQATGGASKIKRRVIVALILLLGLSGLFTLFFFTNKYRILRALGVEQYFPIDRIKSAKGPLRDLVRFAQNSVLKFDLLLLVSSTVLALHFLKKNIARFAPYLLLGIVSLDLFLFGMPLIEGESHENYRERIYPDTKLSSLLSTAAKNRERFVFTDDVFYWMNDQNQMEIYPNRDMVKGLFNARGYDPLLVGYYTEFFNAIGKHRQDSSPGALLSMEQISNPKLLSVLNIRHLLTYSPLDMEGWEQLLRFPSGLIIYENTAPLGDAFLAQTYAIPTEQQHLLLKVLSNPKFPFHKRAVSFEENPWKNENRGQGSENVRLLSWTPDRREYEVSCQQSDILVFSETFYPGWRVRVDGEPDLVIRVDHALSGVFLPPGRHHVVYSYRPWSFIVGSVVSLATLLGILVWLIAWQRRAEWTSPKTTTPPGTNDLP